MIDRRRRRRELPGHARAGDALAAFEDAPCYRADAARREPGLTPGGGRLPAADPERDAADPRLARVSSLSCTERSDSTHAFVADARAVASLQRLLGGLREELRLRRLLGTCAGGRIHRQPQVGTPISTRERGAARSTVRSVCFQNASEATGPGSLRGPCWFHASTSSRAGRASARRS